MVRHPAGGDLAGRHRPHNLTAVLQEHVLSAGIYGLPGGRENEGIAVWGGGGDGEGFLGDQSKR